LISVSHLLHLSGFLQLSLASVCSKHKLTHFALQKGLLKEIHHLPLFITLLTDPLCVSGFLQLFLASMCSKHQLTQFSHPKVLLQLVLASVYSRN
jgi:hypothetical protein